MHLRRVKDAPLATSSIRGNFIRPEPGLRVYWTKVSIGTYARIEHIAGELFVPYPACVHKPAVINTIVQLQKRAAA